MPHPDIYDDFEYDDEPYEEDCLEFDCHLDLNGYCGKAGSEECEFECPFYHLCKS
jgi:hypothetical protein